MPRKNGQIGLWLFGTSRWWWILGAATLAGLIVFGMRTPPDTHVSAQSVVFTDGNGHAVNLASFGGKVRLPFAVGTRGRQRRPILLPMRSRTDGRA